MPLPKTFEEWWKDSGAGFNEPRDAKLLARDLWICAKITALNEYSKSFNDWLNKSQIKPTQKTQ